MHPRTLTLTASQHAELVAARAHDRRPYLRERAAALLKVAEGQSAHHVARQGLSRARQPDTLYRWLDAYTAQGLAGLVQRPRGHRGFSPCAGRRLAGAGARSASGARFDAQPLATGGSGRDARLAGDL